MKQKKFIIALAITVICLFTTGFCFDDTELGMGDETDKNPTVIMLNSSDTTKKMKTETMDAELAGVVADNAYVSSANKDKTSANKKEMGTKSDQFRAYFRINISEILKMPEFAANKDNARVQLILPITGGSATDKTTFTLKAYADAANVDFSKLTWNSVNNKEGSEGEHSALHWSNGKELVSDKVGYNVSVEKDCIIITLAYRQIADLVDADGNIIFAFATNTDGLKIGSLDNKTEANRPMFKVILSDEHFHVFDQEVAAGKYFVSANCKSRTRYRVSCSCGEAGTETFAYGGINGHTYSNLIAGKAKTCTTDGVKDHYECLRCGKYFFNRDGEMKLVTAKDLVISAGHDYKLILEKPTCTKIGWEKHYKCESCTTYFDADKKEITSYERDLLKKAKLSHTYDDGWHKEEPATCTEAGTKGYQYCSVCKKNYDSDGNEIANLVIPATGHTKGTTIYAKKATCNDVGWTTKHYKCSVCSGYYIDDEYKTLTEAQRQELKIAKHPNRVTVSAQAVTCTEDGWEEYEDCPDCEYTTQVVIPATGHTKGTTIYAKKATCNDVGWTTKHYKCSVCSGYYIDDEYKTLTEAQRQELKIAKHPNRVTVSAQAVTCTEDGWEEYEDCPDCEYTTQVVIPATGHTKGTTIYAKNATCDDVGWTTTHYKCKVCSGYYIDDEYKTLTEAQRQELKIAKHPNRVTVSAQAVTCTEDGWEEYEDCPDCEYTTQVLIPATGHTEVTDEAVAPTCTETGLTEGSHCSECGEVLDAQEVVDALGHTEVIDAAVPATCTATGLTEGSHCSVCDEVLVTQEEIPALGHDTTEEVPEKAPECTVDGYSAHMKCSRCDYIENKTAIPATGHNYKLGESAKPATCTTTGWYKWYMCKNGCGKYFDANYIETTKEEQKIPAKGHTEVIDAAVTPTCTETGLTEGKHCSVCDAVLVAQEVVGTLDHNYVDGTCTSCGAADLAAPMVLKSISPKKSVLNNPTTSNETIPDDTQQTVIPTEQTITPAEQTITPTEQSLTPVAQTTPSAPEPVTPAPEATPSAPEPVTPAPEATPSAPEPVTPAPEATPSAPEPVTPAPEATPSAPEPVTPAPEATPSAPESVTPAPVVTSPAPEPVNPEPVITEEPVPEETETSGETE